MMILAKQLIIDKNIFQATKTDFLCRFAENHFLILPEILLYECSTGSEENKDVLLDRFEKVRTAGGRICPNIKTMLNEEAKNLLPYGSLVNPEIGENTRLGHKKHDEISHNLREMSEYHDDNVWNFLNPTEDFYEEILSNHPELSALLRQLDASGDSRLDRFKFWLKFVEQQGVHRLAMENLAGITDYPEEYCLSDKWVSWHFIRVTFTVIHEYNFLRHHSPTGITENRARHDLRDAEYVCILSRAGGLLTRDERLVGPLAKAAFPEKDIFSSLDQVPEDYICHWS